MMPVRTLAITFAVLVPALARQAPAPPSGGPAGEVPPAASAPLAFADFSWLNGNCRQNESVLDTKYFTGEFRADINAVYDFNHPQDHTIVGSCETGRSDEVQVQQLGIGGDFHWENVRGRLMTQFGMDSVMTPRNDASPTRGQWNTAAPTSTSPRRTAATTGMSWTGSTWTRASS